MNKKIKFMLATMLTVFTFLTINITAHAEASTYSLADRGELKSLDVESTESKSLELFDNYDGYKMDLTDQKSYYVTLNGNSDGVKIFAQSAGDNYVVKVFESDRKNATPHNMGENISVEQGKSTLYVRTFTSEDALKRAVKNEDVTNCDKTYKINVYKTSTDQADGIYLDKLTLGGIPINFNKDILSYNISVSENNDEVTVTAIPENEDYAVKIAGYNANDQNSYAKTLHLQSSENVIKINVTGVTDNIKTYILNINRGKAAIANNSGTSPEDKSKTNDSSSKPKCRQWVQIGDKWQYNDDTGNPLKNVWFYDKNSNKNYYLKSDGNMATGWIFNNGHWYYLNESGRMQTGWNLANNEWYYLNSEGIMQVGWIKDLNGKYYYLQSNGAMTKNTTIEGYKLGVDGCWVH